MLRRRSSLVLAVLTAVTSVVLAGAPALAAPAPVPVPPAGPVLNVSSAGAGKGLGDRSAFTMLRTRLSDRSELAVNVGSGNLVLRTDDLRIAGVGQELVVGRYYNSQETSVTVGNSLPLGWSRTVGADIR